MQSRCCQCNGNGLCVRCNCARNGRSCQNCLPLGKDRCRNSAQATRASAYGADPTSGAATSGDGTNPGPASFDVGGADADLQLLSSSCPPLPNCQREQDRDTAVDTAVDTAMSTVWDVVQDMSQGVNPYSVRDSQIQLLATLDCTQQEGTQDPVSQPQTDASDLDADHEDGTPTDSNGPGQMTTLPEYATVQLDRFTLGSLGGEAGSSAINDAYAEAVHYRPNAFEVPNGSAGRAFVAQLSKYLLCFGNAGSFEGQALKVAMVFQQLLLQKPFSSSSTAYAKCLQRRLDTWQQGDLGQLLHECRTIQSQLEKQEKRQQSRESDSERQFASLVETGKLGSALRQLSDGPSGGIHHLDDVIGDASVRDILRDKHPQAEPLHLDAVIPGQAPAPPHPVLFESLTREVVRRAALHTQGAAGPSGVDADSWRRMCTSFGECSDELCDALAKCARRLATTYVDPTSLEAYVACRLIPLDKKPGVRPIGIGEVMRRILGKAILRLTNQDIKEAAGSLQLCAGQENGIEAAIHAMHDVFQDEETEGILLADASNAFNRLNRAVCLCNVQHLCPSLAPTVINSY